MIRQKAKGKRQKFKVKFKIVKIFLFISLLTTQYLLLSLLDVSHARPEGGSLTAVEKLFLEENYDGVIRESSKLVESNYGKTEDLYYLRGLSQLKTGKFNDARRSFEAVIDRDERSNLAFDAHLGIADAYLLEGNKTRASRTYEEILKKFPGNKNLAIVHSRLKQFSQFPVEQSAVLQNESGAQKFTVQTGCFSSKRNAERMAEKLSRQGYRAHVELPVGARDNLYRVKVSGADSRKEADGLALRLNREGFSTKICQES